MTIILNKLHDNDTNAIGIYKELNTDEEHQVILVGHLPIETSFLLNSFLKSREENTLIQKLLDQEKEKMDWLYLVYIMDVHPRTKLRKHWRTNYARLANCMHTCKLKYRTLPLPKKSVFENWSFFLYSIQVFDRIFNKKEWT